MTSRATDVYLQISSTQETSPPWAQAKDPQGNAINYWYQFTGGDDQHGNVTAATAGEEVDVTIGLQGSSNGAYDLHSAGYKSTSSTYSEFTFENPTRNKITIKDGATTDNISIDYRVIATPNNDTTPQICCDPTIRNKW